MTNKFKEDKLMALTDESNFTMPVTPMYGGGNGFGANGDWAW